MKREGRGETTQRPGNGERIEERAHAVIQWVLRTGLGIATTLMLFGFVMKLASGDHEAPAVSLGHVFQPVDLADRLMVFGVLILGLTPGARVLALLALWIRQRDWRFVGIAAAVLMTLCVAAFVGSG